MKGRLERRIAQILKAAESDRMVVVLGCKNDGGFDFLEIKPMGHSGSPGKREKKDVEMNRSSYI